MNHLTPAPERVIASRARRFRRSLVMALLLSCGALFAGAAPDHPTLTQAAVAATLDLQPSERHRKVARLVGEVIERSHYRQAVLDDKMSSLVFDRYLESLDSNRNYFLASDVAEFERFRFKLDEAIRTGKVEPA